MTNNLAQRAVRLASAVYRVTKLFPQNEVLRNQLRLRAGDIVFEMSQLFPDDKDKKICYNIKAEIEGLKALFEVAQEQNWLKPINFEILNREYTNLEKEIENFVEKNPARAPEGLGQNSQAEPPKKSLLKSNFNRRNSQDRRSQVLEYLKSNGQVKIGQVCQLFPQISRRTLIRDLEEFSKSGLVQRNGNGRGVYYQYQVEVPKEIMIV